VSIPLIKSLMVWINQIAYMKLEGLLKALEYINGAQIYAGRYQIPPNHDIIRMLLERYPLLIQLKLFVKVVDLQNLFAGFVDYEAFVAGAFREKGR
jgi:hypothetical protein